VLASVQFHRLLSAQENLYPATVLRVGTDLVAKDAANGFQRTLFFRTDQLLVQKRIEPWSRYAEATGVTFEQMQQVYASTRPMQGVIHSARDFPKLEHDKYTVELYPLGFQYSAPVSEHELQQAAHGLLHGLAAIHKVSESCSNLLWLLSGFV
jgi:hypothetical protein